MKRALMLLTVVALMVVMLAMSVSPAFARSQGQEGYLCVSGVAQTFGPDPGHSPRDALKQFCGVPIGKPV